jgi:hypothetical protein
MQSGTGTGTGDGGTGDNKDEEEKQDKTEKGQKPQNIALYIAVRICLLVSVMCSAIRWCFA